MENPPLSAEDFFDYKHSCAMNMVLLHNKKGIPRRVSLFGASDLTRTGDLLITSANFAVFYRFVMYRKVLQRNGFSNCTVLYRLATKRIFF